MMRHQGRITEWNDPRGFGFIAPLEGGDRVFVHVMAFPPGSRRPSSGEYVNYSLVRDDQGRLRAEAATYITHRATHNGFRLGFVLAGLVAAGAMTAITIAAWAGKLPMFVPVIYFICSLGAYLQYRKDKAAAQRNRWRADEVELLTWGLFGGWPGALIAQHQFRHKIKKTEFQILFWIIVALNCAGLAIIGKLYS